jgi:tetratricopeptide (TPR) repeat protein
MLQRFLYTLVLSLLALEAAYAACERAQEHYQQAMAPGVARAEQIRLLEGLLKYCDSFAASYTLGHAYAAQGNVPRSLAALRQAAHSTNSNEEKAWAWHTMARLHETQHDSVEALLSYKTAWRLAQLPEVARDMLALEDTM